MGKLTELAERCEQATGPDRELNADILEALADERWRKLEYEASLPCGAPPDMIRTEARYKAGIRFDFTGSIDTAMTLVPDGWHISFLHQDRYTQAPMLALARNGDNSGKIAPCEEAATLALALCAAALRARHSTPDTGKDG